MSIATHFYLSKYRHAAEENILDSQSIQTDCFARKTVVVKKVPQTSSDIISERDEAIRSRACPDTPADIFVACHGCHPVQEAFSNFISLYPINDTTKQALSSCVLSEAGVNIRSFDLFKANVTMCTEKKIALDQVQRDAMVRVLDLITSDASSSLRSQVWNQCAAHIQSSTHMATPETSGSEERQEAAPSVVPDTSETKKTNDSQTTTPHARSSL